METTISDFQTSFYIPATQILAFHLPHMRTIHKNNWGEMRHTAFKRRELFQDVLCLRDYAERLVARFADTIQPENYGGNRSVSIEGIVLECLSELLKSDINSITPSHQRHAEFHSFLSDDIKHYADNTTEHIKYLISFLKEKK